MHHERKVFDLVEAACLDHPSPEFTHRHPQLVDQADVVRLGPFPTRKPRHRRGDRRGQLTVRGRVALDHRQQLGRRARPFGRAELVLRARHQVGWRHAHPVDGRQREFGVGLPGVRSHLPLVGAARTVVVDEVLKPVEEGRRIGGPRCAQPVEQAVHAVFELGCEFGAATGNSAEFPHRMRRLGRVDLADAGDDRHDQVGPTHRRGHGADDPDWDGRHVRRKDVMAEQILLVRVGLFEVRPDLVVRHGREVGPGVVESLGRQPVGSEFVEVTDRGLRQRPPERLADLDRCDVVLVAVHLLVWRDARLRSEELIVHVLPRQAGCAFAEHSNHRRVQVAVPADHPELTELASGKLVELEGAHPLPRLAPAQLRPEHEHRTGQRCDRVGKHLADVRPRVDRKPLGQFGVGDVVALGHGQSFSIDDVSGVTLGVRTDGGRITPPGYSEAAATTDSPGGTGSRA